MTSLGKKSATLEEGRKIRESLTKEDVLDALGNGLTLLRERVGENTRVGTMGFCMGGGFALLGARNSEFDSCINYYGIVQNIEEVEGLKCPVQLVLGGEDERVNAWAFQKSLPAAVKYKETRRSPLVPKCPTRLSQARLGRTQSGSREECLGKDSPLRWTAQIGDEQKQLWQ